MSWAVVEEAVGKRAADALMEEDKEQRGAGAVVSQTIGIAVAVTLEQPMGSHFAQVIAQLSEGVALRGKREA